MRKKGPVGEHKDYLNSVSLSVVWVIMIEYVHELLIREERVREKRDREKQRIHGLPNVCPLPSELSLT